MIAQRTCLGILLIVFAAFGFLLCTSEALADAPGNRTVTVTYPPLVTPDFGQCDAGEQLTVINGGADTIEVSFNDGSLFVLAPGESRQFDCTDDPHDCYTVWWSPEWGGRETSSGCSEPAGWEVPTLSQWVLIVLALSVGGFFVWQLKRRRAVISHQ